MRKKKKKRKGRFWKFAMVFVAISLLSAIGIGYGFYKKAFYPNVNLDGAESGYILIPTGSDFKDVLNILDNSHYLISSESFRWTSERMRYIEKVRPGRYLLHEGMSNRDLVALLRSGKQAPVQLTFNNLRTVEQLAGKVSAVLEPDSIDFVRSFNDTSFLNSYNLDKESFTAMFLPNTYEFYWNTDVRGFVERMREEYDKFWNESRIKKAQAIGMSPKEVSVVASIVEMETNKSDEKSVVAGVYINRYKKGWKLEADPTLIYALGDYDVRRVLNKHKKIDSPYNTYLYPGLPPGPICIPSLSSLDAVLNYQRHDYMFFCAREDFSGYHNFACTYQEHRDNARKFQRELNKRKIKS